MIERINWRNLDECHRGISENQVDWRQCPIDLKHALIVEYRMTARNVVKPSIKIKEYRNDQISRTEMKELCNWYQKISFWVIWVVFAILAITCEKMSVVETFFAWLIPGGMLSYMSAIIIGGAIGIAHNCINDSKRDRVLKKEESEAVFNQFIKGCRK